MVVPKIPDDITGGINNLQNQFASPKLESLDTVARERLEEVVGRLQKGNEQVVAQLKDFPAKLQEKADQLQKAADAAKEAGASAAQAAAKSKVPGAGATPPPAGTPPAGAPSASPAPATAKPPTGKEVKLDPKTGGQLRERLLSRFGQRPPAPTDQGTGGVDDRVDWKDWLDN